MNGREKVHIYGAVMPSGRAPEALTASSGHPQSPAIGVENLHLTLIAVWSYGNVGVRPARRITGSPLDL
jgi:hypothetical protein